MMYPYLFASCPSRWAGKKSLWSINLTPASIPSLGGKRLCAKGPLPRFSCEQVCRLMWPFD